LADFSIEIAHRISRDDVSRQLPQLSPPLRLVAKDWLAESHRIDFVTLDPEGHVVLVLQGSDGEDTALLVRALAHRAWVKARLDDWRQLAPQLGIAPQAMVRCVLLCPSFLPETVAAAETLEGAVQLVLGCTICLGTDQRVVFEALTEPTAPRAPKRPAATAAPPETSPTEADPGPDPTPFRSGLTEADLGLLPEDLREFV
jgi:hypothetical protein